MAAKQLDLAPEPKPTAVALLEFGRLLHAEDRRISSDRNPSRIQQAEEQLVQQISGEKNASLRSALNFNVSMPIDPLTLRIFAVVGYLQLCSDNLVVTISGVVKVCVGDEPEAVLAARKTIAHLLITKRLILKPQTDNCVELGRDLMGFLSGGKTEPPLALTESELRYHWLQVERQAAKRRPVVASNFAALPNAKQLAEGIHQTVIGLDEQVRTIASRLALHLRRSALIRSNQDPGCGNECLLFIGPSGCGKTYLAEAAGKTCGLPFTSFNAGDLTSEAYVGLSVSDIIKSLITAAGGDLQKAAGGVAYVDEIDKKAASPSTWRDVGGLCVQQEILRLMEGTEVQVGGRRSGDYSNSVMFNTRGTMFLFGGAFTGLELSTKKTGVGIGFGAQPSHDPRRKTSLYGALEDYGMIPEFLNRLSAIVVLPEPTVEQLLEIAIRSVLPSHNRLLATYKAEVVITPPGLDLLVATALQTGTFARGLKSVVTKLTEEIAYEAQAGRFEMDTAQVRRAIEAVGLG